MPGAWDEMGGKQWFLSSQILCKEKADIKVHSYYAMWYLQVEKGKRPKEEQG